MSFPKLSKTASGIGDFSPNFLNKKPEESQRATGLPSKGRQFAIKLIVSGLYLCFTILRRFVPPFILNFFVRADLLYVYLGSLTCGIRYFLYHPSSPFTNSNFESIFHGCPLYLLSQLNSVNEEF
jgi:hypothetical protein